MSGHPARRVRLDHVLRVVAEGPANLEDGPQLVMANAPAASALVRSSGNLIQVASHGAQLTDGTLERDQFILWQWGERAQVRSHKYGDVRGGGHTPGCRPLVQEYPVVWP